MGLKRPKSGGRHLRADFRSWRLADTQINRIKSAVIVKHG